MSKIDGKTVERPAYERLMENFQMPGFRNPEERGVHRSTPQCRGMRVTEPFDASTLLSIDKRLHQFRGPTRNPNPKVI